MNILHIAKYYPPEPGGIENFVCDLAVAQAKNGHNVYVICHQAGFAKTSQYEKINKVSVARIRTFGELAHAPVSPEFIWRLRSAIHRFRPDVIHAHVPNISAFWLRFLPKTCPLILHWHADVVASTIDKKMSRLYPIYKPWETWLLKRADRIICTSNAYLNTSPALRQWQKKCAVIPLGLDPERMAVSRKPSNSCAPKNARFSVLSVGRFSYYKGFSYLIEAAKKISDTDFIIVGDGPERRKLKQMINHCGLQNRVWLPGKVSRDELMHLFDHCDVFCLPSLERTEAFGMVLLEAMHFGKPLITTEIHGSGVNTVNMHKITGLQVPAADPQALAEAFLFLKNHPEVCLKMGKMGHARFNNHFDIQPVANRIETIYNH